MNAQAAAGPAGGPREKGGSREKTEKTRQALLEAGVGLFSEQGYEATSTRQVEARAGVQRNLMTYHFGSKEEFWKACMVRLNERMTAMIAPAVSQSTDIEPAERIRFLIRRFVRASAAAPEIGRIMFDEGRCNGWRLKWLVDEFNRDFFKTVGALYEDGRERGVIPDIPLVNFYYFLVGSSALFSMSAECELMTGQNTLEEAMVDAQADAVAKLLTIAAD
ncbi:MAG: TetR/AcrR family transcriptional regulator [Caulobacterales bacterium]|nr:TetR/AcrR family transcriptional regulator [Caulobacterales bacterium]